MRRRVGHFILGGALLVAPGCYNGLELDANAGGPNGSAGTEGPDGGDGSDGSGDGSDSDGPGPSASEVPAPSARIARLSHTQWENTVQDLLYLDSPTGFSAAFRADPTNAGYLFDNSAAALELRCQE